MTILVSFYAIIPENGKRRAANSAHLYLKNEIRYTSNIAF
jgi:hypothetical protein